MSIISDNEYCQYKSILSGCNNVIDAHYFSELYISGNQNMKNFVTGMIYGKEYETSTATFSAIKTVCKLLGNCKTKNEACKIINDLPYKNKLQLSTFTRIANSKQDDIVLDNRQNNEHQKDDITYVQCKNCVNVHKCAKKNIFSYEDKKKKQMLNSLLNIDENCITKNCPHCGNSCSGTIDTTYIICDYNDPINGFQWNGCGKDWCFYCEKKLCKQWGNDELYNEENRKHTKECCKKMAKKNEEDYEEQYCQC
jgi:hypothetical protein